MSKSLNIALVAAALLSALVMPAHAQLVIPSDGSDGDLIVASNTVIDLSQAVTGSWDARNDANRGKGIYDSNKWAVVFKYNSVTVSNGATLTFANHPSRAPVVWLVKGGATIAGTVSLNGEGWQVAPLLSEGGPGGFRGGFGSYVAGVGAGPGFGPGGGQNWRSDYRAGGSYGSLGEAGSTAYGNPSLLPLVGGSGGSGDTDANPLGGSGGGGGGAILIAVGSVLEITGTVRSNGGSGGGGNISNNHSAGGSGGGIRVVCDRLTGNGVIQTLGGGGYHSGGLGRIRIERVAASGTPQVTPDPSIVPLQAGAAPLIWLPSNGPEVRVVSVGAQPATADPRGSFGTFGPDISLPNVTVTPVVVETTNVEDASVVTVRVSPRANGIYSEIRATLTQTNSLIPLVLRWQADVPVNSGFSALQVKVVRP